MMGKRDKEKLFNAYKENPYAKAGELAKKTGILEAFIFMTMARDKDFKKSIESIRDVRDGITGA